MSPETGTVFLFLDCFCLEKFSYGKEKNFFLGGGRVGAEIFHI